MQKEKKDKHFIHKPHYEGGLKALRAFISKHKKYPKSALKDKIEGTVVLRYTIDHKGKVVDAKVIKSLDPACDQEAIRVVKLLKFEVHKHRKRRILFHKRIQVHFRLPKEQPKAKSQEVVYTVTPTKKTEEPKPEKKGGGYTIQIEW